MSLKFEDEKMNDLHKERVNRKIDKVIDALEELKEEIETERPVKVRGDPLVEIKW
jgi:hypothetical protein